MTFSYAKKYTTRKITLESIVLRKLGVSDITVSSLRLGYHESLIYDIERILNTSYDVRLNPDDYNNFQDKYYEITKICGDYFHHELEISDIVLKYDDVIYRHYDKNFCEYEVHHVLATQEFISTKHIQPLVGEYCFQIRADGTYRINCYTIIDITNGGPVSFRISSSVYVDSTRNYLNETFNSNSNTKPMKTKNSYKRDVWRYDNILRQRKMLRWKAYY